MSKEKKERRHDPFPDAPFADRLREVWPAWVAEEKSKIMEEEESK